MRALSVTVTAPAENRQLITLADLREQLQFRANDTAQDSWLTKVIYRASRQAERYCDRIFAQQDYREIFGGVWSDPLELSQAPVTPATLIISLDDEAVDPTNYTLDSFTGLVRRTGAMQSMASSSSSLTAEYTGGFGTIPDDVQQAVLMLCIGETAARGRDPMLRAKETPNLGRSEYWVGALPGGLGIPMDIAALLNPYRNAPVA